MMIGVESEEEAHYLCALLNSSSSQVLIRDFTIETQLSTKLLDFLRIEKYVPSNELHKEISSLGKNAFDLASVNDSKALSALQEKIDYASSRLWGVTKEQMAAIKKAAVF